MKVIKLNFDNLEKIDDLSATLGNFDGVHLGHRKLLDTICSNNLKRAFITFWPHPRNLINNTNHKYIISNEQKREIIKNYNFDYYIEIPFNEFTKNISKEEFMKVLSTIGVKEITCGKDYHFAKGRTGSINDLEKKFSLTVINDVVCDKEERISSTIIRKYIIDGNIEKANELLGYKFTIKGKVISGNQLGRTIGFPTANIEYSNFILPKNGAYHCEIVIDNITYNCMTNIGINPTMNELKKVSVETNIFDFNEDIYDEIVELKFIRRIRDEKKFSSVDELVKQLNSDKENIIN